MGTFGPCGTMRRHGMSGPFGGIPHPQFGSLAPLGRCVAPKSLGSTGRITAMGTFGPYGAIRLPGMFGPFGMIRCPEGAWDVSPGRSPGLSGRHFFMISMDPGSPRALMARGAASPRTPGAGRSTRRSHAAARRSLVPAAFEPEDGHFPPRVGGTTLGALHRLIASKHQAFVAFAAASTSIFIDRHDGPLFPVIVRTSVRFHLKSPLQSEQDPRL